MRADLGALLDDDDREFLIDLLQVDRRGEARRPGADDHHIEFHRLAFDGFHCRHFRRVHACLRRHHLLIGLLPRLPRPDNRPPSG